MEQDNWLTQLYLDHKQELLLVAWNVVHRRELAEDVVHEGIVRLAKLCAPPNNPRMYAIKTVRNLAIDIAREHDRHREEPWYDEFAPEVQTEDSDEIDEHRFAMLQNALIQLDSDGTSQCERLPQGCFASSHFKPGVTWNSLQLPSQSHPQMLLNVCHQPPRSKQDSSVQH